MNRYWCSWWSGYYLDEGCSMPPFQIWISTERARIGNPPGKDERTEVGICALIDSDSKDKIMESIKRHFPDFEMRFMNEHNLDFEPPEHLCPNFKNQTLLTNDKE